MSQGIVIAMPESRISYAESTRRLKENLNLGKISVTVTGIKKAQVGHLIMAVGSGEEPVKSATTLKAEAERELGPKAVIRYAAKPAHLEVIGIENIEDVIAGGHQKRLILKRRLESPKAHPCLQRNSEIHHIDHINGDEQHSEEEHIEDRIRLLLSLVKENQN